MCDETSEKRFATVIAVDLVHVFVICPYCGEIHEHGSNGSPNGIGIEDDWGYRVSHCVSSRYDGEYKLIGNPFTVKSEKRLTKRTALNKYRKAIKVNDLTER